MLASEDSDAGKKVNKMTCNRCGGPIFKLDFISKTETSQEELPITSWSELSIIECFGLNSVEMSEKDLEAAFLQIALAFRSDQYTLKQRLQAEEHARNLAEENIQLELSRGRETLETLKGLCLDSMRSKVLQRLELSLAILAGTVERISNTAEVLGAVHQEARVSRAVELVVAHVENLRRQHDRNVAALQGARVLIEQQSSGRNTIDPRVSPDPEESDNRQRSAQQNGGRRRISVSVISSPAQERRKQDLRKQAAHGEISSRKLFPACSSPTKDDRRSVDDRLFDPDETSAARFPLDSSPITSPEWPTSKQPRTRKIQNKNSPLDTLRQRHKGKAGLSKKKADKDKKSMNTSQQIPAGMCGSLWRQCPPAHWLHCCRWALLCMYLMVLFCIITLTYYLWKLHDGALEP
uniref:protein MRVI1 n=1 Tax=Monopterus albus TaxID=43700 RepID=UPI0009B49C43|nr:protein MRVI1-like [Monopterus albus]